MHGSPPGDAHPLPSRTRRRRARGCAVGWLAWGHVKCKSYHPPPPPPPPLARVPVSQTVVGVECGWRARSGPLWFGRGPSGDAADSGRLWRGRPATLPPVLSPAVQRPPVSVDRRRFAVARRCATAVRTADTRSHARGSMVRND